GLRRTWSGTARCRPRSGGRSQPAEAPPDPSPPLTTATIQPLAGEVSTVALEPSKLSERVRLPSPALTPTAPRRIGSGSVESSQPRGVAQSGSAPGWGPGGRRFKSCLPDTKKRLRAERAQSGSRSGPPNVGAKKVTRDARLASRLPRCSPERKDRARGRS